MPTTTPHLGLNLPDVGSTNWNVPVNDNFSTIDTAIGSLSAEVAAVTTPVASVFGRTGAVTAESGDYSFSEISGTVSPSQLPVVPLSSLSGVVPIANGGTGASDAVDGRENLGAAVSGVNDDITQLTGLTTPLSIAQGGTGETTAAAALAALGALSVTPSTLSVSTSISIGGSQALTGVHGTSSTIAVTSGSFMAGNFRSSDSAGNEIDSGYAGASFVGATAANTFTGTNAFRAAVTSENVIPATSGTNQLAPGFGFLSEYWNGSSSSGDSWTIAPVFGSGTTPATKMTFTHTGSGGFASVAVPALELTAAVTVTSATAGSATALPATPSGYVEIVVNGTTVKIPYYS